MEKKKLNYASAGVDITAADEAVEKIKNLAKSTFNSSVLSEIGSFGGFFKPELTGMNNPVLISSADGVGTKLKIAFMLERYNTVGQDLVNHCVDDILVHGAKPLFFMDYIATGKLKPEVIADIVEGFANGCRNNGMALLGGETAEMPDFYGVGEFDLAGFIVGIVDQEKVINGSAIKDGDTIIGLESNGLHTNGYSLARKIAFEICGHKATDMIDSLGMSIGDALLLTHKSYLKSINEVLDKYAVNGMAHITGGGLKGNFIRIIPENLKAEIDCSNWKTPPLFEYLQTKGEIETEDMYEAFNMGIGYILVVDGGSAHEIKDILEANGEKAYIIGQMKRGTKEVVLKY